MQLRDDVDISKINWSQQAQLARRYAESLAPGLRRNAAMDRVLACEAMARSIDIRRLVSAA